MSVNLGFQGPSYFNLAVPKSMSNPTKLSTYLSNATSGPGGTKVTVPNDFKVINVQLTAPSADLPSGSITLSWPGATAVLDKNKTSASLSFISVSDISLSISK